MYMVADDVAQMTTTILETRCGFYVAYLPTPRFKPTSRIYGISTTENAALNHTVAPPLKQHSCLSLTATSVDRAGSLCSNY
ncbi:unnamed protein product [Periconia digitata]|uniref:Uncharacterized protein n=1 Tax=Periconia digitata TaxID=1303443 RepID=A0A9W4UHA0_9PLEO|nr:unnamed protein product [Periconia digitata]